MKILAFFIVLSISSINLVLSARRLLDTVPSPATNPGFLIPPLTSLPTSQPPSGSPTSSLLPSNRSPSGSPQGSTLPPLSANGPSSVFLGSAPPGQAASLPNFPNSQPSSSAPRIPPSSSNGGSSSSPGSFQIPPNFSNGTSSSTQPSLPVGNTPSSSTSPSQTGPSPPSLVPAISVPSFSSNVPSGSSTGRPSFSFLSPPPKTTGV